MLRGSQYRGVGPLPASQTHSHFSHGPVRSGSASDVPMHFHAPVARTSHGGRAFFPCTSHLAPPTAHLARLHELDVPRAKHCPVRIRLRTRATGCQPLLVACCLFVNFACEHASRGRSAQLPRLELGRAGVHRRRHCARARRVTPDPGRRFSPSGPLRLCQCHAREPPWRTRQECAELRVLHWRSEVCWHGLFVASALKVRVQASGAGSLLCPASAGGPLAEVF